ncbi:hypothetical protein QRX60_11465 [Amycolatopsis mongoliensis]|uniref:Uncharacterized protein n=1 Tax=Amycolatopsis mongoliensis TaxID=715475 RepID=A0A9Y2NNG0_9PSEU|nr:hypothetical protein [Amycolatopsis sp. 4-36]WIY04425.1 hypothetical protein QRX60_11465 [Amycolatopsis sp. 4-36]
MMAAVELIPCGHCDLTHIVIEVRMVRCPCRGTGRALIDGVPVYPFRPCGFCPGDGQIATFDEVSVTAQERVCRHEASARPPLAVGVAA